MLAFLPACPACLQTFYMYNLSQAAAFWIVTALIFPLSQVSQLCQQQPAATAACSLTAW
jgi:hypothetical protein